MRPNVPSGRTVWPTSCFSRGASTLARPAERTNAGNQLPAYYLVYLLLVDLLGFENLGKWEKIAWSVPVDFEGRAFLIDHRKSGLGVFAAELPRDETAAGEIVSLIRKGSKPRNPISIGERKRRSKNPSSMS
jgi:hypothetical protein